MGLLSFVLFLSIDVDFACFTLSPCNVAPAERAAIRSLLVAQIVMVKFYKEWCGYCDLPAFEGRAIRTPTMGL